MRIIEIEIFNFRNFDKVHLNFNEHCNIFLGENGQGKTNLLEAIYLLARGQSFRPSDAGSFVNYNSGKKDFLIRAKLINQKKNYLSQITFQDSRKKLQINGKKVSSLNLTKLLPVILFSPESLASIKGGSQERRILIDDMVVLNNPENADLITHYTKVLRARNCVLKDFAEGKLNSAQFNDIFCSLTVPFLKAAADLTFIRLAAIAQIQQDFQEVLSRIFSLSAEVKINYIISSVVANAMTYKNVYDALNQRASELRSAEIAKGISLVGPHRHDIEIYFDGKNSRYYCSQGQQRALILSLKLAQMMYHQRVFQKYPILLLDDVLSELDLGKKMNFLDLVGKVGAQVFMTTTDRRFEDILKKDQYNRFEIACGNIALKSN